MSAVKQQDGQIGCSARPQREKRRGVPLRYAEALNDARTPLADFFNFLPGLGRHEAADHTHLPKLLIALSNELIGRKFYEPVELIGERFCDPI